MTRARGPSVVVVGVGNEFRRDDGIGPEVLSRLRRHADGVALRLVRSDGEPASMIEAWTGAQLAVVVDAVVTDAPVPGRMHRFVLGSNEAAGSSAVSSHGLGVGEAVGLAAALGRLPGRLIIHAVETADVGYGVGLTPAVSAVADDLTAAVLRDVRSALQVDEAPSAG
jgi:hydrogenase maturation protease